MARKDIHRPSVLNPADYNFVACDYYGGNAFEVMYVKEDREIFRAHMAKTGGHFAKQCTEGFGTCYVCGATAMYVAKFHHTPSNEYIVTGMDCAEKMSIGDPIAFRSFRKRIANGLKLTKGKMKARGILADLNLSRAWEIYEAAEELCRANKWQDVPKAEYTVRDIVGKVIQYGNISEGQAKFLVKLHAEIDGRAALAAKRAAEMANAEPVPVTNERVSVKGKVLTTRASEGPYGTTLKMLVQTEAGYKLWGTVPSAIMSGEPLIGATVEFDAKLQRSDKDEKFGFFSRPTKANVIARAASC